MGRRERERERRENENESDYNPERDGESSPLQKRKKRRLPSPLKNGTKRKGKSTKAKKVRNGKKAKGSAKPKKSGPKRALRSRRESTMNDEYLDRVKDFTPSDAETESEQTVHFHQEKQKNE